MVAADRTLTPARTEVERTMPTFRYEGMDGTGAEIRDTIESASAAEAAETIRRLGYFVTKLELVSPLAEMNRSEVNQLCSSCRHSNPPAADRCERCGAWLSSAAAQPAFGKTQTSAIDPESSESRLLELLRQGKKIQAIKLYREMSLVGLKEAKDYVEALASRHQIPSQSAGCAGMLVLTMIVVVIAAGCSVALSGCDAGKGRPPVRNGHARGEDFWDRPAHVTLLNPFQGKWRFDQARTFVAWKAEAR
jgi:ribosomal protein L7/L12